jgi:hypothetical protein
MAQRRRKDGLHLALVRLPVGADRDALPHLPMVALSALAAPPLNPTVPSPRVAGTRQL